MARPWTLVRSDIAVEHRKESPDPDLIADLRLELRHSRAADYLTRLVDEAPPLTPEQLAELAAILNSAADLDATGLENCGEQ